MSQPKVTEWRDPVQLYRLRWTRRRMILAGVLVAVVLVAAYWYLYIA